MSAPGILCVGRLYADLIFTEVPRMPTLGTEIYAGGFGIHAGGGAYISAAWFAALGHEAALASILPGEPFRAGLVTEIEAAGVSLAVSRPAPPGLDPQVTVAMVAGGDRAFLTRRSGAPCPDLAAADIRRSGAAHVHIGELATLMERPAILTAAREAGVTVSLDCSWDETLDLEPLGRLLPGIDVFLPNAGEAEHLGRAGIAPGLAGITVIKRGAEGATALIGGVETSAPADPVEVVDATGAGDAFNAGFLSAWLADRPVEACLAAGNALGARAISGRGGFPEASAPQPAAEALAR
ncbi:carbohydrate kinase family protein [Ovoidimarina sediminis]|uniref:carbohydrate kinase family protein n=1 Tax=Ovoidimarina sediminis TaxID=3079856 RepID=UPI00290B0124|nr:PfkB family carbohydrate kinase [Rhodophyticola sp. MJ-SS7]MDU8946223.1 PfkB family carbohydrate kinase [Rhodophyticola sp. MJ-SS7]